MVILDDLLLGILTNAVVVLIDRKDARLADDHRRALEKIKQNRSPVELANVTVSQQLQDEYGPGTVGEAVAQCVASDPVLSEQIGMWLIEADPDEFDRKRVLLLNSLGTSGRTTEEIAAFLTRLDHRVNQCIPLASFRSDQKLRLMLRILRDCTDFRVLIVGNQSYMISMLERVVSATHSQLEIIKYAPQPWTTTNDLLVGAMPSLDSMNAGVDVARTVQAEVLKEAATLLGNLTALPGAILFEADPQRGKTTFLLRVGIELVRLGHAVVKLPNGTTVAEAYGRSIAEYASQLAHPLVLLVDDPLRHRDHFVGQMLHLQERRVPVLVLIATRRDDWNNATACRQVRFLSTCKRVTLDPNALEGERLVRHLEQRGVIAVDPRRRADLIKTIRHMSIGPDYFHRVIECASSGQYKPIPVVVMQSLNNAKGDPDAAAFERLYEIMCAGGAVGLPTPQTVIDSLLSREDQMRAHRFAERMERNPLRYESAA